MDYYSSHRLASQGQADMLRKIVNRWKQRSPIQKTVDVGLSAAFVAISVNLMLPDMHKELEKWNPEYQDACYTHDPEAEGLISRTAYDYTSELYDILNAAGPYGQQAIGEMEDNLSRNVLCVGPAYKDKDVAHWLLTGVTIVDENYPAVDYAFNLASSEFSDFWDDSVEMMEERLVYNDALLYSRFERAIEATEQIDIFYRMAYEAHGEDHVFDSAVWQSVLQTPQFSKAATAYQEAILEHTANLGVDASYYPLRNATPTDIMQDTMKTYMQDGDALNEGDLEFMSAYYRQMRDSYQTCRTVNKVTSCTTHYTSPPSYVHSRHLTGEHVARLTSLAYGDSEYAWVDPIEVEAMLRDTSYANLYSDRATSSEENIASRINRYNTQDHDTHRPITDDYLIDGFQANNYHQKADATPRPLSRRQTSGLTR